MEQLRLRPSDAVWTKVDKRIRKERRRRRVVLWLPLFLLCVVAGGYFYFDTQSNNNKFTASELTSTHNGSDKNTSESTSTTASGSENNSGASVTAPSPATEQTTAPANKTTEQTVVAPRAKPLQRWISLQARLRLLLKRSVQIRMLLRKIFQRTLVPGRTTQEKCRQRLFRYRDGAARHYVKARAHFDLCCRPENPQSLSGRP